MGATPAGEQGRVQPGDGVGGEREPGEDRSPFADATHRSAPHPGLAAAIYGQVLTTGTVAAVGFDEDLPTTDILVTVAASIVVLWIAHIYSEALAHGGGMRQTRAVIRQFSWPIVETAVPSLLVLALAALGVISRSAAVTAAEVCGALVLFTLGALVARRSGASLPKALLFAVAGAVFGLAIAAVKSAVH